MLIEALLSEIGMIMNNPTGSCEAPLVKAKASNTDCLLKICFHLELFEVVSLEHCKQVGHVYLCEESLNTNGRGVLNYSLR